MIYQGKFTCPDCGKTYKWFHETIDRMDKPGYYKVTSIDEDSLTVALNLSDTEMQHIRFTGYCKCGYPISVLFDD